MCNGKVGNVDGLLLVICIELHKSKLHSCKLALQLRTNAPCNDTFKCSLLLPTMWQDICQEHVIVGVEMKWIFYLILSDIRPLLLPHHHRHYIYTIIIFVTRRNDFFLFEISITKKKESPTSLSYYENETLSRSWWICISINIKCSSDVVFLCKLEWDRGELNRRDCTPVKAFNKWLVIPANLRLHQFYE